ncbi:MAG: hypothetical protein ABI548_10400 [Polyangiaceae bacterium]
MNSCGGKSARPSGDGPALTAAGGMGGVQQGDGGAGATALPLSQCFPLAETTLDEPGCQAFLQCPAGGYLSVYCNGTGDGAQLCTCRNQHALTRHFEVSGLTGLSPCDAVASACAALESPDANEPSQCSLSVESRASSSCQLQRDCIRSVKVGSDVTATVSQKSNVSCADDGTGQLVCGCDDGPSYLVSGQDGMQACDTLLDTCAGDSPVPYDGESTCKPGVLTSGGDGFCSTYPTCQRAAKWRAGLTAIENGSWDLDCTSKPPGSACGCINSAGQGARFDVESATEGSATCTNLAPLCGEATPVALSNNVTCVQGLQAVSGESCTVEIDCKQPATFDGQQILVYGTVSANCGQIGDKFVCTCLAADDSAQIEVSTSTLWDACSAAAAQCPDAVRVTIGDGVIHSPSPPR